MALSFQYRHAIWHLYYRGTDCKSQGAIKESCFLLIGLSCYDFYTEFGECLNHTAEYYYTARQNRVELSWQRLTEEDAAYWREMKA